MNIENTQSQMRKGILEFCILSIIRRGESYPSDIVEEMKGANLNIFEGTLYPLLTRLKNADMLTYRWVESNSGPPRKYFSLTQKGEAFYRELEQTWQELSDGVNALTNKKENNSQVFHNLRTVLIPFGFVPIAIGTKTFPASRDTLIQQKKPSDCRLKALDLEVIPFGFEPKTDRLEICCSIQLSYGTIALFSRCKYAKIYTKLKY